MSYTLKLRNILANHQSESDGDELFLKNGKKKVWPLKERYQKVKDTQVEVMMEFTVDNLGDTVEFELWEYDNILSSSCLGSFTLLINEKGGPFRTDLTRESKDYTNYSLIWEVS